MSEYTYVDKISINIINQFLVRNSENKIICSLWLLYPFQFPLVKIYLVKKPISQQSH